MIKWGHSLCFVSSTHELSFNVVSHDKGGSSDPFTAAGYDLIIGADGALAKFILSWRQLHLNIREYHYTTSFELLVQQPSLSGLVNRGSFFAYSDHGVLLALRMSDGSIVVGIYRAVDLDRKTGWRERKGTVTHQN